MEIHVCNLTKCYKSIVALDNISLSFFPGINVILGPNGSGKSTLMNILSCNLKADSGRILLDGTDISKMGTAYREKMAYVPQEQSLYQDFSPVEFLYYIGCLNDVKGSVLRERTNDLLNAVGLYSVKDRKISSFSGGMKQRLHIAQALINDPEILILDEPTVGLDLKQRVKIRNLLSEMKEKCIIYSTHIVSDVDSIVDYLSLFKQGRILFSDHISKLNNVSIEEMYIDYFGMEYNEDDLV